MSPYCPCVNSIREENNKFFVEVKIRYLHMIHTYNNRTTFIQKNKSYTWNILRIFAVLTTLLVIQVISNAQVVYVDISATGLDNGSSWANAYNELQDAIDTATAGDTIWVAEGIYFPTESPDGSTSNNRDKAFHLDKNVVIFGGFDGTETVYTQRGDDTLWRYWCGQ